MRVLAVINRDGGTFRSMDIDAFLAIVCDEFRMHGHTIEVDACNGDEIVGRIEAGAARADIDVLLVGGGDGTVSTAAAALRDGRIALGILPAGTMNLFARTLQVPLDLYAAARALAAGTLIRVDYATANGKPFVHQYALGLHARMVRMREKLSYGSRVGKIMATTRAVYATLRRLPRVSVQLDLDGEVQRLKCTAVAVSNNPYGPGHIPYADDPRSGVLGVYVCTERKPRTVMKLTADIMMGTWRNNPSLQVTSAKHVLIEYDGKTHERRAVIDGELESLADRTVVEIQPAGLEVLVPGDATYLDETERSAHADPAHTPGAAKDTGAAAVTQATAPPEPGETAGSDAGRADRDA